MAAVAGITFLRCAARHRVRLLRSRGGPPSSRKPADVAGRARVSTAGAGADVDAEGGWRPLSRFMNSSRSWDSSGRTLPHPVAHKLLLTISARRGALMLSTKGTVTKGTAGSIPCLKPCRRIRDAAGRRDEGDGIRSRSQRWRTGGQRCARRSQGDPEATRTKKAPTAHPRAKAYP